MAAGMSLAPETLEDFSAFLREHLSDSLEKARTQAHSPVGWWGGRSPRSL